MVRPDQDAIDTFMSITGVSEAVAIRKLEEHGGNINEAVNAHFNEAERNQFSSQGESVTPATIDFMDVDEVDPVPLQPPIRTNTFVPSDPFSLLGVENIFGPNIHAPQMPLISHPREVREVPIEVKDGNGGSSRAGGAPLIEDATENLQEHGPEAHGIVIVDDEDDGRALRSSVSTAVGTTSPSPSAPAAVDVPDYGDDIEEEMIRAAIEASKQDIAMANHSGNIINVEDSPAQPKHSIPEDAALSHAVSFSLQTAEQEKAVWENEGDVAEHPHVIRTPISGAMGKLPNGRHSRVDIGSTSHQGEAEDVDDLPLVRRRRRRVSSNRADAVLNIEDVDGSPPSSPRQQHNGLSSEHREGSIHANEWGGISSQEHDEAIMLEAAMFGGVPETVGISSSFSGHAPRPLSPSLASQRLIREQQDDEYLASLQADQEKELKAKEEAEAALAEERLKEAELFRKLQEEKEHEKQLAMKEASLPQEPASDDGNAVTLLVRMPDGSRRGRRFLKSDSLQCVFNFIDIGRAVKPGTYRLVRSYPRRAFGNEDGTSSLDELGLTCKQEALYLELI